MIFAVSTVKDSPANVAAYVARNLAAGVDHLMVFLDAPDPEVEGLLAANPHVTHVVTDEVYWQPERPSSLNARQVTNANLAMHAIAGLVGSHWIFHIDADEVLEVDRDRLDALDESVRVARLAPLEAVSQMVWPGEVTHFKRMLTRPEVDDLVERGLIPSPEPDEPANGSYFRGHVQGKVGVRPNLDLRMQLHRAVWSDPDEVVVRPFDAPWLRHLHYESHSGEEFVRKWMAHLGAGEVRFRPRRSRLRADIEAIAYDDRLDEASMREALIGLYRERIEDDLETLLGLGLLVEPSTATHAPRAFPEGTAEDLREIWELLRTADKRYANPQLPEFTPVAGMTRLRGQASSRATSVLDRAIERAATSREERGAAPLEVGRPTAGRGWFGRPRRR